VAAAVAALLALALFGWALAAVLHWVGRIRIPPAPRSVCELAGSDLTVTPEQAGNAATVAAVALRRGLPELAVVVALATALQESKLVNVEYGDRDSLGLFQQRPSQGWGTAQQILDPAYAAGRFYDALLAVPGWQRRPVTEVAQRVQQSAHPRGYARWEPLAGALAHALAGRVPAGISCRFPVSGRPTEQPERSGLTARAGAVLAAARAELGARRAALPTTRRGNSDQNASPGRALALASGGWFTASWLVAHAEALSIRQVGYAGRTWTPDRGWQPAGHPSPGRTQPPADRVTVVVA
jgi:hypothetical protein